MENYFMLDGKRIPMSDETAKSLCNLHKTDYQEFDYQQLVIDWLGKNDVFFWKKVTNKKIVLSTDSHANILMFIDAGKVQERLLELAYFGGEAEHTLYLYLSADSTWQQIYHRLEWWKL